MPTNPTATRRRDVLMVTAVALGLLLPFLSKPFHLDDPLFVWAARQVAAHPLDPYGFTVNWEGRPQPMSRVTQNPPLVPYYLAAAAGLLGWTEAGLHLAMVPVSLLAVVGTYRVAADFCRRPAAATLLMVASAAFLVSATTLMSDVPLLCAWVWAVHLWVGGSAATTAAGAWARLAAAAVVIAAATMAKYPGMNLVPLLALHAVLCPAARRRTWVPQGLALLLPVAVLAAYDQATNARYGVGLVRDAVGYARMAGVHLALPPSTRALDTLCFTGGTILTVAGVAVVAFVGRGGRWAAARWAAVPVAAVALGWTASRLVAPPAGWVARAGAPAWFFAEYGLLAAAGLAVLIACLAGVRWRADRRRGLFLLAWVAGVYTFTFLFNWTVNARTILPMVPAACILAVRAVDGPGARRPALPFVAATAVAAVVALAVAVADDGLARADRLAADRWAAEHRPPQAWFVGHWGFQYYVQLAGARPVDDDRRGYPAGDWLVVPTNNYGSRPPGPLRHAGRIVVGQGSWLSTMSYAMGSGFYFSSGDRLPFVVAPTPPETFDVYQFEQGPSAGPAGRPGVP